MGKRRRKEAAGSAFIVVVRWARTTELKGRSEVTYKKVVGLLRRQNMKCIHSKCPYMLDR